MFNICSISSWILCFLILGLLDEVYVHAENDATIRVEELMNKYSENKELLQKIPGHYQIVYPVQIHHNHSRVGISTIQVLEVESQTLSTLDPYVNNTRHFKHTTIRFKGLGQKFTLKLDLNEYLLSAGVTQRHFVPNETYTTFKPVEHCYYQGTVRGRSGSLVAVRTCDGISGVIHVGNNTYIIQPLHGGNLDKQHPHIFYVSEKLGHHVCGNTGMHEWGFSTGHSADMDDEMKEESVVKSNKFVELALVIDKDIYAQHNSNLKKTIEYVLQVVNMADMYFHRLNTRLVVVYVEVWGIDGRMSVSTDVRETLLNFMDYSQSALLHVTYDAAQLLSGAVFRNAEVGLAKPDSICTRRSVGVSQETNPVEPQQIAITLTHIIGHIIGMSHDNNSGKCACKNDQGCLMAQELQGKDGFHPQKFSTCSKNDYQNLLQSGTANCLFNRPTPMTVDLLEHGTCGNGVLEFGEHCDCGANQIQCEKTDPCCDVYTCKLKEDAECSSGPCCKNCKLSQKGVECREARSECDIPEYCDGISGQCPMDIYVQDGQPCYSGRSYCYKGLCPSLTAQCQTVWGAGSMVGDPQCFERFNMQGSTIGNCGTTKTGKHIACFKEDVLCGLLLCQRGSSVPLIPGLKHTFSKTIMSVSGAEFECKTASGRNPSGSRFTGLVMDGTKCAVGSMCLKQECVSLGTLGTTTCTTNNLGHICSGHGVCTNLNKCYCEENWTGFDCSIRINITTTTTPIPMGIYNPKGLRNSGKKFWSENDDTVFEEDLDESAVTRELMFIILGAVVGAVVVVFAVFAVCYRRRSNITPWNKKYLTKNNTKKQPSESDTESLANRIITFGSMPSYRETKILENRQKKKGKGKTSEDSIPENETETSHITSNDLSRTPEKGILKKASLDRQGGTPSAGSQRSLASQTGSLQSQSHPLGLQKEHPSQQSLASQRSARSVSGPAAIVHPQARSDLGKCIQDDYNDQSSSDTDVDESLSHDKDHDQESADVEDTGDDSVQECKSPVLSSRHQESELQDGMKKLFSYYNNSNNNMCTEAESPDALPPPPFESMCESSSPQLQSFKTVCDSESSGKQSSASNKLSKSSNIAAPAENDMEGSLTMPEPMKLQNVEDILQQIQRHSSTLSPMSSRSEDGLISEADTDRTLYRTRPPNAQLDLKKFAVLMKNEDEDSAVGNEWSSHDEDNGIRTGDSGNKVMQGWSEKARGHPLYARGTTTKSCTPPKRVSPPRVPPLAKSDSENLNDNRFVWNSATGSYFVWKDEAQSTVKHSTSSSSDVARNLNCPQNQKPLSLVEKDRVSTPSPSDNEHVTQIG